MTPVFCIGETLEEREANITEEVCARQIDAVFAAQGDNAFEGSVIAYEPVWAIGTGKTASVDQVDEVHQYLRSLLEKLFPKDFSGKTRILYGGSVNPDNVKELMSIRDVDGALVGGASLAADKFINIIKYRDL